MQESLPILSGLVLGALCAAEKLPVWVRALLAVVIAACATFASGEWRVSLGYLGVDLAEVAGAGLVAWWAVRLWIVEGR